MKLFDWLKDKLKSLDTRGFGSAQKLTLSSKTVMNLMALFCIGIIFIIVANFFKDLNGGPKSYTDSGSPEKATAVSVGSADLKSADPNGDYAKNLEYQLSDILSKINNAGDVSVMITLKSGSEIVPAKDETVADKITDEKDTSGGTRTINETNTADKVVFQNQTGGESKPLIVKQINPEIKGVIVVAEGAKDAKVKLLISQAVQTVLDVPAYRVTVYERN